MTEIRQTITGADALSAALSGLPARVQEAAKEALKQALLEMRADAQSYPPERPGQRYVRTEDLKGGWDGEPIVSMFGEMVEATLENPVGYGPYVMGPDDQAAVHQGRWRTTTQIQDAHADQAQATVQAAVDQVAGST